MESFDGRLRDECPNVSEFVALDHVRAVLEAWRDDCNHRRPHGALGHLTPSEFAARGQETNPETPALQLRVVRKTDQRHCCDRFARKPKMVKLKRSVAQEIGDGLRGIQRGDRGRVIMGPVVAAVRTPTGLPPAPP